MKSKFLLLLFLAFLLSYQMQAQVTASFLNGVINDQDALPLAGAIVEAVHVPSGTVYISTSTNDGRFNLSNLRVGGPYRVTASFIGYKMDPIENVYLSLGEPYFLQLSMVDASIDIGLVEIIGQKDNIINAQRTGASTNIDKRTINTMPTISRSINDFTRLTPQAGAGSSFAGRDGRYNNITIDGANFNNNFGLSSNNLPGGNAQPISLDAIEEIQVNVAPYDVRQTNFTGAGINAITRSGDNNLSASVYGLYRNENFNGKVIAGDSLPVGEKTTNKVLGARIGGPIIKDKVFFFVNGEWEDNVRPGIAFRPNSGNDTGDNISRTTVADMQRVSDFVRESYGYDPGRISDYANDFSIRNYKALARIDWNISKHHKLAVRYNEVVNTSDQVVNGTSAPNPRASSNRVSANSFAFENANYGFENSVRSFTAELNSSILQGKASNQLLATFTRIEDKRTSGSSPFPFIDIWQDGDAYMSLGYELFSWRNEVLNDVITVTNNFTYYLGKHTITAGASYDYLSFANSFQRYGTSYYRFASVDDFVNGANPTAFGLTYSLLPGGANPVAELEFGLLGVYVQDEYLINNQFKLTYGVRIDQPMYLNDALRNPAVEALTFKDNAGNPEKIIMDWPTSAPLFSPRVGFNYDVKGDRTLQVRGGTGIFTGRLPFVWFTNLPTNSGMIQNTVEVTSAQQIADLGLNFDPNPNAHVSKFPQNAGESAPGTIASIHPDFKMPQVWRTNLGFDNRFNSGTILTLEAIYTKDINAVWQRNVNQDQPVGSLSGPDTRPLFDRSRVVSNVREAMVLDNTNLGDSYALTVQLTQPLTKGFFGTLAYTYTNARDITGNPGSQAASAWTNNVSVRGQNDLDLAASQYAVPHRIMAGMTYSIEYFRNYKTTFSLFYNGAHQGRFSYRYNGDVNNDGNNADLLYIPNDPSEIQFADIIVGGEVRFSAQDQSEAFFKFIDQDSYLSKNKGKYAERNGALLPFLHRFDFSVMQELFTNIGGKRNSLELRVDILNAGNIISSSWGVFKRTNVPNAAILVYNRLESNGQPSFRMAQVANQLPTASFANVFNQASAWGAQVGLRYTFN